MFTKSYGFELPPDSLPDGLYWVRHGKIEGGFTIKNSRVVQVAPRLQRDMSRWFQLAVKIAEA